MDETITTPDVEETATDLQSPAEEASLIAENAEDILGPGPDGEEGFMSVIEERLADLEESSDADLTSADVAEGSEELQETSSEEESKDFPKAGEIPALAEDEKAQAKWGELRSELEEARKELNQLRDQSLVSELENQLNEIREQNQTYEQELAIARVEKSPEYTQAVTEPMQRIMDHATAIADNYEDLAAETIYDTLSMDSRADQNAALARITENMAERDKVSLYRMVDDMEVLWERDSHLKEHAAEALAELEQREQMAAEQASKQEALTLRSAVSKVFESLEGKTPDVGVGLEDLKSNALKEDFSNLTPANKAFAIAAGSMLTPMIKALRERDSKIAELSADLQKFRASDPRINPDSTDIKPSDEEGNPDRGFLDGITEGLQDIGIRFD